MNASLVWTVILLQSKQTEYFSETMRIIMCLFPTLYRSVPDQTVNPYLGGPTIFTHLLVRPLSGRQVPHRAPLHKELACQGVHTNTYVGTYTYLHMYVRRCIHIHYMKGMIESKEAKLWLDCLNMDQPLCHMTNHMGDDWTVLTRCCYARGTVPVEASQAGTFTWTPPVMYLPPCVMRILRTACTVSHHVTMCTACPVGRLAVAGAVPKGIGWTHHSPCRTTKFIKVQHVPTKFIRVQHVMCI
jgi:hypothetical protein